MNDVRSLLQEVVDEPAGTPADMEAIRRRAGRHAARQRWVAALVAIGIALAGIGVASLVFGGHTATPAARISRPKPSAMASPPSSHPSNPGSVSFGPLEPCTAAQLSGGADTAFVQGATQSLIGSIVVVNHGSMPCRLSGRPSVRMIGPNGELSVQITSEAPLGAASPGRVIVAPGRPAEVTIRWTNWCGPPVRLDQIGFQLWIGRSQRAFVVGLAGEGQTTPICGSRKYPSTLGVSRWSYPGT